MDDTHPLHPLTQAISNGNRAAALALTQDALDAGEPATSPTTEEFAREIGADGYAADVGSAVDVALALVR